VVFGSSIWNWLSSRFHFSVAMKFVEPHGLHFEANVLVSDNGIRIDCKVQQHVLIFGHIVREQNTITINSGEKSIDDGW